jgi:hypothetical protein
VLSFSVSTVVGVSAGVGELEAFGLERGGDPSLATFVAGGADVTTVDSTGEAEASSVATFVSSVDSWLCRISCSLTFGSVTGSDWIG